MNDQSIISLREYQINAMDSALKAWQERGITRILIQLPTGTGKTIVFASLAKKLKTKTLIIAHRDELIRQAQDKIGMVWPEAKTGIVKASENDFEGRDVVIASIQSLAREKRLKQFTGQNFGLCIVDEAHHSVSRTYRDVINALGFTSDDPSKMLLGVTATTKRLDKLGLKNVFQEIVFERTILTMIKGGYLSDIRGYRTNTGVDLTTIKTSRGDFIEVELSVMVNTPERNKRVVESYIEHAQGRKAVAFTAGIQHAIALSEMFNKYDVLSKSISGKTPDDERKEILKEFTRGKIKIVCNCNILTEGYDEPSIDCILMARPTKSSSLYTQMVGRGTRKHPGKSDCIVIDFTDKAHNICALPDLLGKEIKDGESILEVEEREEKEKRNRTARRKDIGSIAEFDILGKSIFRWTFYGVDWRLPVGVGAYVSIRPRLTDSDIALYNIFIVRKDQGDNLIYNSPLDLNYAQGIGEDYARKNGLAFASKKAKWRQNPSPTEKQIEWLKKFKIFREGMTKGEASDALDDFFAKKAREKL